MNANKQKHKDEQDNYLSDKTLRSLWDGELISWDLYRSSKQGFLQMPSTNQNL